MIYYTYMKLRNGWSGLSTSYSSIHAWLGNKFGKADMCEFKRCTNKTASVFYYALRKGFAYERKRRNFIKLCASCHKKYDMTDETRKKLRKANLGKKYAIKPVIKLSLGNEIIAKYESLTEASKENGISISMISYVISGRKKSGGGYLWKNA